MIQIFIRAFGCVLYEMITLKKLFEGENEAEIRNKIMNFNEQNLDLKNIKDFLHPLLKK